MDIFNSKKIIELEKKLSLKEKECISLKSDVSILERDNYEMKIRLGEGSKVSASVKISENSFMSNAKKVSQKNEVNNSVDSVVSNKKHNGSVSNSHNNDDNFVEGVVVRAVAVSLVDNSGSCSSDSSDCSD